MSKNENTSSPEPAGEPRERRPSKSIKNPKGAGRPRIINRVTTKTSQDGLRDGLTRATFIVPEKTLAEIKEIVFKDEERRPLKYHIAEALSDYVEKIKNKEVNEIISKLQTIYSCAKLKPYECEWILQVIDYIKEMGNETNL